MSYGWIRIICYSQLYWEVHSNISNNTTQIGGALSLKEGSLHDLIFQGDTDVTFF